MVLDTHKLADALAKAAAANPVVKEKLLKDPKGFIEKKLNIKLPKEFKIMIHEDTPAKLNIILPAGTGELSELELSSVTGGLGLLNLDENLNQLLLQDEKLL